MSDKQLTSIDGGLNIPESIKNRLRDNYIQRNEDLLVDLLEEINEHNKAIATIQAKIDKIVGFIQDNNQENNDDNGEEKTK